MSLFFGLIVKGIGYDALGKVIEVEALLAGDGFALHVVLPRADL